MVNMKRWSDAKLDKELAFARAAKDENDPANLAWLAACEAEANRRDSEAELAGLTTDPRQADFPQTEDDTAGMLRRKSAAAIKPNKPQAACDVGLFSDDARQIDLEDLLR
jgi:hypothetical protein